MWHRSRKEVSKQPGNSAAKRDDKIHIQKAGNNYNDKLIDGNLLFQSLPHEIFGMILEYISLNDFIRTRNTSATMKKLARSARLIEAQVPFWTARNVSEETHLAECRQQFLDKYLQAGKEANNLLQHRSLPSNRKLPINVLCFGKEELKRLCMPSTLRSALLNLPRKVTTDDYLIQLEEVFGVSCSHNIPAATYQHAAMLVCFVNDNAEFRALSEKFLAGDKAELKKKIIMLAHPAGVKIDTGDLLSVNGCLELTPDNCDQNAFTAHILKLIRKSAAVYLTYSNDPSVEYKQAEQPSISP